MGCLLTGRVALNSRLIASISRSSPSFCLMSWPIRVTYCSTDIVRVASSPIRCDLSTSYSMMCIHSGCQWLFSFITLPDPANIASTHGYALSREIYDEEAKRVS